MEAKQGQIYVHISKKPQKTMRRKINPIGATKAKCSPSKTKKDYKNSQFKYGKLNTNNEQERRHRVHIGYVKCMVKKSLAWNEVLEEKKGASASPPGKGRTTLRLVRSRVRCRWV